MVIRRLMVIRSLFSRVSVFRQNYNETSRDEN